MLSLVPMLIWFPAVVSATVLIVLLRLGELSGRTGGTLIAWFVVAAYLQYFHQGPPWAIGVALQTILAVSLLVRVRPGAA